jgi:hypothetical protein
MPTRFFMPPDSSLGIFFSLPARPTARRRPITRASMSAAAIAPRWTSGNATLSATDRKSNSA